MDPAPSRFPPPNPWPKYIGFGCLLLVVLLALGGVLVYYGIRTAVGTFAAEYASDEPLQAPAAAMPAAGVAALENRLRSFGNALDQDRPAEPLALTEEELNVLVQRALARRSGGNRGPIAQIRIVGSRLEGLVSIPLASIGEEFQDRYLNGKARISVGVVDDRLVAHLEDLKVGDHYVPDSVRERISGENLLKDAYNDPEVSRYLTRLQSVEIGDGKVVLTPKSRASNSPEVSRP